MMKFVLLRYETSDQGTFGVLFDAQNNTICQTGELPRYAGNPNIENEVRTDCIPAGTYQAALTQSPKFGRVYLLKNVKGRSAILIHAGNYCGDKTKGYKSDVEGCLLLGQSKGFLSGQKAVLSSKKALASFMALTKGLPIEITIKWKDAK